MELLLRRRLAIGDAIPGEFFINGKFFSFSLERASLAITPGRYRVRLTESQRVTRGELWSPDEGHRLPLIDGVPGRSGLRIHAANVSVELEGCIALGKQSTGDRLTASRAALTPFLEQLAELEGQDVFLTIEPAGAPAPLAA